MWREGAQGSVNLVVTPLSLPPSPSAQSIGEHTFASQTHLLVLHIEENRWVCQWVGSSAENRWVCQWADQVPQSGVMLSLLLQVEGLEQRWLASEPGEALCRHEQDTGTYTLTAECMSVTHTPTHTHAHTHMPEGRCGCHTQ